LLLFATAVLFAKPATAVVQERVFNDNSKKMQNNWFESVNKGTEDDKAKKMKIQLTKMKKSIEHEIEKHGKSGEGQEKGMLGSHWIRSKPYVVRD